jgi:hypothetical protein
MWSDSTRKSRMWVRQDQPKCGMRLCRCIAGSVDRQKLVSKPVVWIVGIINHSVKDANLR